MFQCFATIKASLPLRRRPRPAAAGRQRSMGGDPDPRKSASIRGWVLPLREFLTALG